MQGIRIIQGSTDITLSPDEWVILRDKIINDTLAFWDSVSKDVDGGILPMELASSDGKILDRDNLMNLRNKLKKILMPIFVKRMRTNFFALPSIRNLANGSAAKASMAMIIAIQTISRALPG